jgi:acyl-CoA oxidase
VAQIGSPHHLDVLKKIQQLGLLGCFCLTEKLAGVNSGLVVETTCTYDPNSRTFDLHTPSPGATKNWISQGLTADYAVVMAAMMVGKKNYGPHAFLMQMRDPGGQLVKGVTINDMGAKTIGNDLDNASISYDHVKLPLDSLLNRYSDLSEDGNYTNKAPPGVSPLDMIGQRLYTGRVVIAESTIVFAKTLYADTKRYADAKTCWAPGGLRPSLSSIPQLKFLFLEADEKLEKLDSFLSLLKTKLTPILHQGGIPSRLIVEGVAAAKVACIETSIDLCHRLKQEVGSFALVAGSGEQGAGFERTDYLQCCKFAEGDSRILMQKLARDRVIQFSKGSKVGSEAELQLCAKLSSSLGKLSEWDLNWVSVYQLSQLIIDRILNSQLRDEISSKL